MAPTTARVVTIAACAGAAGAAIAAHSIDRKAPATAVRIKKRRAPKRRRPAENPHRPKRHNGQDARPDASLAEKLAQSNPLARGKDIIDRDAAVAPISRVEIVDGRLQVLRRP